MSRTIGYRHYRLPNPALTSREEAVLALWLMQHSRKAIAEQLGISRITVNHHLENIREKMREVGE